MTSKKSDEPDNVIDQTTNCISLTRENTGESGCSSSSETNNNTGAGNNEDGNTSIMYKGYFLDIAKIVEKAEKDVLTLFKEKTGARLKTRTLIKSLVCSEFEEEVRCYGKNNKIYIAEGVRCDDEKKLKHVIDHLYGAPHNSAVEKALFPMHEPK